MTKDMNDGYMGSGKRIGYAIKKYGIENFKKEILSTHDTPEEMLAEEARLVNEEFIGRDDVYNLACGGKGSWFHVNQSGRALLGRQAAWIKCKELAKDKDSKFYLSMTDNLIRGTKKRMQEMAMSPEGLQKMRESFAYAGSKITQEARDRVGRINSVKQAGSGNSQFGTCWIFSDLEKRSMKIKNEDVEKYLSSGWRQGRKMKFSVGD
jgi:hypothetical protein